MRKRTIQAVLLALLLVTLLQTPVVAMSGSWTEMNSTANMMPTRADMFFIYDSQSDVVILFGGTTGPVTRTVFNDTWAYEYDSNTWTNMTTASFPSGRYGHQAAYHSGADRIIMFSGATDAEHFNETWSYDYDSNTWTDLNPSTMPPLRRYGAMAYDSESDKIILFGGVLATGGTTGDTWAYDYDTNTWENMNPVSAPSSRFYSLMAYDSESDRIILFSGVTTHIYTDTWAYDYNTNTWENMHPEEHGNHGSAAMAYNTALDACVIFGGTLNFDETLLKNETWMYDYNSNTWTNVSTDTCPSERSRAFLAYDIDSNVTVLHGGMEVGRYNSIQNDTWVLDDLGLTPTPTTGDGEIPLVLIGATVGVVVAVLVIVVVVRRR